MSKINEQSLETIKSAAKMRVSMQVQGYSEKMSVLEHLILGLNKEELSMSGQVFAQTAFTSIYAKVAGELKTVYKDLDTVKNFYIVRVILDQVVDDTLAPTVGSDDVFTYSHKNEAINNELKKLSDKLNLNKLIQNIAHDLCFYGAYGLRVKFNEISAQEGSNTLNGKPTKAKLDGVKELKDDVEHGSLIKVDLGANEYAYLHFDEELGQLRYHPAADFIQFTLGGARIKGRTDTVFPLLKNSSDKLSAAFLEKIPKYIRIGKPYFYQMTDKLRELELMEKLLPAVKINKLTQGNLMSVRLPDSLSLEEGIVIANKIEQLINKKVSVDPTTGQITVEAILATAGRSRVVPQFGDKGTVDKFDTKADAVDDLSGVVVELKNSVLDSLGIPSELIYKSDSTSKNEVIKRYSKYLRKLKQLQKAIADGLKQIAFIHLRAKGHSELKIEEIEINFLNSLIEIDQLDKLEFTTATINSIKEVTDFFVNNLAASESPFKEMVDLNKVAEWLDSKLKFVGLSDVVKTAKEGGKLIEPIEPEPTEPEGSDGGAPVETAHSDGEDIQAVDDTEDNFGETEDDFGDAKDYNDEDEIIVNNDIDADTEEDEEEIP